MPLTKGFFCTVMFAEHPCQKGSSLAITEFIVFLLVQSGWMLPGPCQKGRFLANNRQDNTSRVKNAADLLALGAVVKRMLWRENNSLPWRHLVVLSVVLQVYKVLVVLLRLAQDKATFVKKETTCVKPWQKVKKPWQKDSSLDKRQEHLDKRKKPWQKDSSLDKRQEHLDKRKKNLDKRTEVLTKGRSTLIKGLNLGKRKPWQPCFPKQRGWEGPNFNLQWMPLKLLVSPCQKGSSLL